MVQRFNGIQKSVMVRAGILQFGDFRFKINGIGLICIGREVPLWESGEYGSIPPNGLLNLI